MKKERNKNFNQLYYYSLLPWIILGIGTMAYVLIVLVFWLSWKEEILPFLGLLSFFLLVTFVWGIYWMFKIKKCSQQLDKIDKKIEEELNGFGS